MRLKPAVLRPPSPETLGWAGLWTALADMAIAALVMVVVVDAWAPPQDLPWKPLRLADPPGLATAAKFARAAADPTLCRAVMSEGGVDFAEEPDRADGACETANAVRLTGGTTPLSPAAPVMSCPLALAYVFWDRHAVQPAARAELCERVTRIEHYGVYACRNVYGRAQGRRSEHAAANALDVAGFRLGDGRLVTVARHFRTEDERGEFLHRARAGACRWFRATLSPDYNAAHADHLHLDYGRFRVCS
ncbi:MAG: extensin family protein [Phenylobacterium sp.]|uniref:extensin-like domain-containing protein n=1 Tax=Phenylobacterium sp. TaxID=1871053 RepID=UPI00391D3AA1